MQEMLELLLNHLLSFPVLVRDEVTESDEASLRAIEEMQADIVKTSNEATLIQAGLENELNQLEVSDD